MEKSKELLRAALDAQRRIRELQSRREHYLELATSISGMSENRIRSTDKRSRVETAALELVDLAAELGEQATALVHVLREAEKLIAGLSDSRHRQVLALRYLEGKSWQAVAQEMGYDDIDSAYRAHGWALAALRELGGHENS